ncbi:MAG: PEP-CTERM sorting domain-containing protein [bacterium]|nr:PEP-CTERM sorting domain-containing protein [bacterium]
MKKLFVLLLCLVSLATSVVAASAMVIDFESLYPGYEAQDIAIPSGYQGFNWSQAVLGITKYEIPGSGYEYGTIGNASIYTGWANDISFSNGSFDFNGAYITAAWDVTESVVVEGWKNSSLLYSNTITTYNDKAYWFDFNFDDVDTVWFKPSGNHLCIDNITVNEGVAPIPEPGTMMLLGTGLAGMLALRRKRS